MPQDFQQNQRQSIEQVQRLQPMQMQGLEILTLPIQDLETRITAALEENPVLELDESPAVRDTLSDPSSYENDRELNSARMNEAGINEDFEDYQNENTSATWTDYLQDLGDRIDAETPENYDSDQQEHHDFLINSLSSSESLYDLLSEQIRYSDESGDMKNIAEKLIEKIDDSGYLPNDLSEFADNIRISRESLRRAVKFIQSFEPAGIGAQSLQECLLIQLERKGQGNSLAAKIVKKYLPEIEKNRIPFIAESLHVGLDEVNSAIDSIRSLNPIPASAIASDSSAEYIIPEAEVIPKGNEYDVISNRDGYYPRLRLSQHYLDMADSKKTDSSTKDYLRKKIASGQMLISNLELRESTIMKVARVIVSMQHDFMKYGPDKLQPMTLQDVADRLGMHATTISRAAANKYIKTPQGIFSFKDFFSNGFRSKDGDEISASGIREQIKNIISQEDPHKPYSDSKITEILQSKGLDIKRRTVAKYREELGIESSSIRKVF